MNTKFKFTKDLREKYYGPREFHRDFPNEEACENKIMEMKYPEGYKCNHCGFEKFHRLKSKQRKRSRLIICSRCKSQESITENTIFYYSKQPLWNWFYAMFRVTQTKKGISANQLSKELKVTHSSALLLLNKIRFQMTEDAINYPIGGPKGAVLLDEIEVGGKNSDKQGVLVLLEKSGNKLGRVRFAPLPDVRIESIEKFLLCQIAKGTTLHTDGKKGNNRLQIRNSSRIKEVIQVAHWEENYSYKFLEDLDKVVSNLKSWYRGIHHSISHRNISFYLNEFAYRFNRRRSEVNIFNKILNRGISRAKRITQRQFFQSGQFLPLVA